MWKKKAVYKFIHFIAQQPFLMPYFPLKLTRYYIQIQSDYFIHWSYENFSEINKNPHHLKLRNKQGTFVLPDIFETYVWTCT